MSDKHPALLALAGSQLILLLILFVTAAYVRDLRQELADVGAEQSNHLASYDRHRSEDRAYMSELRDYADYLHDDLDTCYAMWAIDQAVITAIAPQFPGRARPPEYWQRLPTRPKAPPLPRQLNPR